MTCILEVVHFQFPFLVHYCIPSDKSIFSNINSDFPNIVCIDQFLKIFRWNLINLSSESPPAERVASGSPP